MPHYHIDGTSFIIRSAPQNVEEKAARRHVRNVTTGLMTVCTNTGDSQSCANSRWDAVCFVVAVSVSFAQCLGCLPKIWGVNW
jgi:hypothetical protein